MYIMQSGSSQGTCFGTPSQTALAVTAGWTRTAVVPYAVPPPICKRPGNPTDHAGVHMCCCMSSTSSFAACLPPVVRTLIHTLAVSAAYCTTSCPLFSDGCGAHPFVINPLVASCAANPDSKTAFRQSQPVGCMRRDRIRSWRAPATCSSTCSHQ
jgi:hypothetical protein